MQTASTNIKQFHKAIIGALLLSAFFVSGPVVAGLNVEEIRHSPNHFEARLYGLNFMDKTPNKNGPYMVLACRNSTFSFQINWRERVGRFHEKRRHLFYHVDGNSHLLLPVVSQAGESTGYVNQSDKAKSLVHEIFSTVHQDLIPIGVFPAGRDPVTGEWIDTWFPAEEFKSAALSVGKLCKFDPKHFRPSSHRSDIIPPAPLGGQ
jgi:hypothetical protein